MGWEELIGPLTSHHECPDLDYREQSQLGGDQSPVSDLPTGWGGVSFPVEKGVGKQAFVAGRQTNNGSFQRDGEGTGLWDYGPGRHLAFLTGLEEAWPDAGTQGAL